VISPGKRLYPCRLLAQGRHQPLLHHHLQFATELVETMTERAHMRLTALVLDVPYEG
jgi:hypothetical protein